MKIYKQKFWSIWIQYSTTFQKDLKSCYEKQPLRQFNLNLWLENYMKFQLNWLSREKRTSMIEYSYLEVSSNHWFDHNWKDTGRLLGKRFRNSDFLRKSNSNQKFNYVSISHIPAQPHICQNISFTFSFIIWNMFKFMVLVTMASRHHTSTK